MPLVPPLENAAVKVLKSQDSKAQKRVHNNSNNMEALHVVYFMRKSNEQIFRSNQAIFGHAKTEEIQN